MLYLSFVSLPMERVWGGRALETIYGRELPDAQRPYGESWEMVDRSDEQSVVANGIHMGKSLHDLWTQQRAELFGATLPDSERFPLLIKILDASDDLSIQVHPPAAVAPILNGEPKTEMWYIAEACEGAQLYVGLRDGSDRESFERAITMGDVARHVHAIPVKRGDSIFIPSGRLHAIGAGLVIFEIQQNSDTTYRVFDWNRLGLDGKPRTLHVDESLRSIDFGDIEPSMDVPQGSVLAACEFFVVERFMLEEGELIALARSDRFSLFSIVEGELVDEEGQLWRKGSTIMGCVGAPPLRVSEDAVILRTHIP